MARRFVSPQLIFGLFVLGIAILNVIGTHNYLTVRSPGMNDFMSRWEGARSFWVEGLSPYSEAASLNIQEQIYSRPAEEGEDLGLFAYPMYTVLYVLPLVYLPYAWASAVWLVVLEACLIGALFLQLSLLRYRPSLLMQVSLFGFTILNYYAGRGLILGQPSHVVYFFTMLALWGLAKDRDRLAGVALALATIKPQMGFLLVPFLMLWGMREGRWQFVGGFGVMFALLFGGSFLLEPGWFGAWVEQVRLYPTYTRDGSPVWILFEFYLGWSPVVGWMMRAALIGVMAWAWWGVLVERHHARLLWTIALTLAVTHTAGPRTATPHYMVFMLVLLVIMQMLARRKMAYWNPVLLILVGIAPWFHFVSTMIPPNLENLSVFLPLIGAVWVALVLTRRYWWTEMPVLLKREDT